MARRPPLKQINDAEVRRLLLGLGVSVETTEAAIKVDREKPPSIIEKRRKTTPPDNS
jgi:hypothetical protein